MPSRRPGMTNWRSGSDASGELSSLALEAEIDLTYIGKIELGKRNPV
jgi:hypothetical protein